MAYSVRQNPASPSNYDTTRKPITKIIIHHAASTSFDSIGQVFANPSRGASAHYGVGRNNNVDQYVQENNTAYHCGNYPVNQESIGIENVNSTGAPDWNVAQETFNTLVELCADIVRRNPGIGKLVPGTNLFGHKEVSLRATACPAQLLGRLQELANRVNALVDGETAPSKPTTPPRKSNDVIANEVIAGAWGNNPERRNRLTAAGYNPDTIQALVNQKLGGGPAPAKPSRPSNDTIADQVIAGAWGNGPNRKTRLEAAGYDFNAVQAIVNTKLGRGSAGVSRKSNDQIANEIVAGQGGWGNNPQRAERLRAAGYDPATIQSIVNRKLGF